MVRRIFAGGLCLATSAFIGFAYYYNRSEDYLTRGDLWAGTGITALFLLIALALFWPKYPIQAWQFFKNTQIGKVITRLFNKTREKKLFIILGKIFRPILIIIFGFWVYSIIPRITDTPLAYLTISDIFKFIGGIILISASIVWLFRGSDDEFYEGWGYFGVLIIIFVISCIY